MIEGHLHDIFLLLRKTEIPKKLLIVGILLYSLKDKQSLTAQEVRGNSPANY
jgi:hypothetical protein